MKKILLLSLLFIGNVIFAQSNIEQLRNEAYNAKKEGRYKKSITLYSKILKTNPKDYDAILALSRLYFINENYKKSIDYYQKIYKNDKTDVEALKGLGDNYLYLDQIDKAVQYYKKGLQYLPDYVPLYLQLAKAYSWQGKLDKAIASYKKILQIDDTYAEAYQGIGKMNYWKEKPNTALQYYQKAIDLDPTETALQKEYDDINKQTTLNIISKTKYVNEQEKEYQINAFIEQFGVEKRMLDHLYLSFNILTDYSDRDFSNTKLGDTTRLYNSTWTKIGWLTDKHKLYIFAGYSASDKQFSTYGINWQWHFPVKSFDINNSFTAGYDYFYYWNNVGKLEAIDNVKIKYKKLTFTSGVNIGIVDKAFILDVKNDRYEEAKNEFTGFNTSIMYQILSKPKVNIAVNYSYLNYEYKSNKYYSPLGRNLYGPSLNIYYPIGHFYFYGDAGYNTGNEYYYENTIGKNGVNKLYINANNWSANAEFGYEFKSLSTSINAERFYNNYYQSILIALNLKYSL